MYSSPFFPNSLKAHFDISKATEEKNLHSFVEERHCAELKDLDYNLHNFDEAPELKEKILEAIKNTYPDQS